MCLYVYVCVYLSMWECVNSVCVMAIKGKHTQIQLRCLPADQCIREMGESAQPTLNGLGKGGVDECDVCVH